MPSVPKTSQEAVVAAARDLIDVGGLESLSVQAVAQAVGVQAPSLYKRFADRAALIRAVTMDLVAEIAGQFDAVATTGSPVSDLRAIAHAHRQFGQHSPHLYQLLFRPDPHGEVPPDAFAPLIAVMMDRIETVVGKRDALPAARLLVSFTHGFVSMEQAGAFRLGGDLDLAFRYGLDRVLPSVTTPTPEKKTRRAK